MLPLFNQLGLIRSEVKLGVGVRGGILKSDDG